MVPSEKVVDYNEKMGIRVGVVRWEKQLKEKLNEFLNLLCYTNTWQAK